MDISRSDFLKGIVAAALGTLSTIAGPLAYAEGTAEVSGSPLATRDNGARTCSDAVKSAKEKLTHYPTTDFQHANVRYGVFSDNNLTNGEPHIGTSNSRIIIGEFYLDHDVEISCDTGYMYKVYYIYTNNNQSQQNIVDMYGSWTTAQHILGTHPDYRDCIKYYILCSKADSSVILSAEDVRTHIHLKNVDGQNPYHIIECEGISNWEPIATGYSPTYGRVFFELDLTSITYYAVANNECVYSLNQNGTEIASNAKYAISIDKGHLKCLVRTTSIDRIMPKFSTFKELYDYLNIVVEPYDYKSVEGSTLFDTLGFYPAAKGRGETLYDNLFSNGTVLDTDGIKFSHTPFLTIYDGYAYITFQANPADTETDNYSAIWIAKIDLSDNSITYKKLVGMGTYDGITFDGACTNAYGYFDEENEQIKLVFSGHRDSKVWLHHCTVDISNLDIAIDTCEISASGTDYNFDTSNFATYIGIPNGVKNLDYEIIMSQGVNVSGTFYSAVSSGAFEDGITAIMKSTDYKSGNFSPYCLQDVALIAKLRCYTKTAIYTEQVDISILTLLFAFGRCKYQQRR